MVSTILLEPEKLNTSLKNSENPLKVFRDALKEANLALKTRFEKGDPITALVPLRAQMIDNLLKQAWMHKMPEDAAAALIAVGGYGRMELHPGSDIDLMILLDDTDPERHSDSLAELLTFFWDIGLEVGHSVRTIAECITEAERDITVATNIMESRLLIGQASLFTQMQAATGPEKIWPSDRFFTAKWEEQTQRYLRYEEAISNLEPNIKESPGGLRDIQMVGWVVKRHYGAKTMHDLVVHGFLTEEEYLDLMDGQDYLWRIRFALHLLTGRREDRILFDYQRTLAAQFGFEDDDQELGVEKFMQQYYRTALRLRRMNEMLLQLFQEVILLKCHLDEPKPINRRFQSRSGFLEVVHKDIFTQYPLALLELFLIMEQHQELNGVRASTIRLIRSHRHLIDDNFRQDIRARSLFMEILRQPVGITHELRRMNRYGILARYIPAFAHIVGRMQYDLFHVFTVDKHTLFVVRNLRRLTVPEHRGEFPLCSDIMEKLPKPELLYIAAIFHDIAKGRGGDHSELGAKEAWDFCKLHGLSDYDSRLVSWLVEKHLLMSITAQRKDTSDPDVINDFAQSVKNPVHLDYLYLLTMADIRATDPKKWNSWKNSLLRELYITTKQALLRGLQNPQEREEIVQNKQAGALHLLRAEGNDPDSALAHWATLSLDYFLYHTWEEIAWQTRMVLASTPDQLPLVQLRKSSTRGGTEIFLYGPDRDDLFAITTSQLDQLGLNIVSARIETANTGLTLNSFLVLEQDGGPVEEAGRREEICDLLREALLNPESTNLVVSRRVPRRLKHFSTPTRIDFVQDYGNQRTIMKLMTDDRPGLLSEVGHAFAKCKIKLINAKIATIGAEAEDTFFITDRNNKPLGSREQFESLEKEIQERLS
ncbi:[protein-PII] uridylyltransferase [Sedimenticola selenatireducens]|uniref:Bifunctional uridylyltransferase/uridylyl-removing enzyme n=1 Tax=Sedimenticola selenatireducens TaxID=191960 RepID=A0A557SJT4_9GAMM|nr:[protein-PII] uridylyltransferase [Sedimenticola selenatireducens]TVO77669.1 [protein-PII] uridylyltransferase [Sedimenticola selenatireducens]TVT64975.1 MAG: [protein-PII] uridylyltransferase [Sedimenticola selenatireducens]